MQVPGLLETSPGVRSCMIEYDATVLPLSKVPPPQLQSILLTVVAGNCLQTEHQIPTYRYNVAGYDKSVCCCMMPHHACHPGPAASSSIPAPVPSLRLQALAALIPL